MAEQQGDSGEATRGRDHGIPGYSIVSRAGLGRRSQWYHAHQVRLGRSVAIKVLRPFLAESPAFREAFLAAGRQAAAIIHPAALPIFNVFPKQACIVMQWCPGRSLRDIGPALTPHRLAATGEVVMDCLAALHATSRCHGNLTTGNIFLDDTGGVWVNDFFQPPRMTDEERLFMAEQRFMAPEFVTRGIADWRTDVYSLGCVLAESLAPDSINRDIAALLDAMRALDPERRGESPQAVRTALQRLRHLEEARAGTERPTLRRKRMYRRVPAEFEVALRRRSATPDETAAILLKVRDIGESGVFVETEDELIVIGSILELDFTLKGVEGNVHAFGIVRWRSSPPMPKGVGVQFMEVDQAGLARLRKFLESK